MLEYPYVECAAHPGEREPGYAVCRHVLDGDTIAHFERATSENLGAICCATCYVHRAESQYVLDNTVLCCAQGLREKGLLASA